MDPGSLLLKRLPEVRLELLRSKLLLLTSVHAKTGTSVQLLLLLLLELWLSNKRSLWPALRLTRLHWLRSSLLSTLPEHSCRNCYPRPRNLATKRSRLHSGEHAAPPIQTLNEVLDSLSSKMTAQSSLAPPKAQNQSNVAHCSAPMEPGTSSLSCGVNWPNLNRASLLNCTRRAIAHERAKSKSELQASSVP